MSDRGRSWRQKAIQDREDAEARVLLLELHLRRVLEAGKRARQIAVVSYPDIAAAWDQAATAAEEALK